MAWFGGLRQRAAKAEMGINARPAWAAATAEVSHKPNGIAAVLKVLCPFVRDVRPASHHSARCSVVFIGGPQSHGQSIYKVRKKAITSGCRDHPPDVSRDLPRSSVASARFFVARSVSA